MARSRPTRRRPGQPPADLPYLPPELLSHIIHTTSDPASVLTMHLLSRRYFAECRLAIDAVLSRQPMAAFLCAYSPYHRLLLLGRAGRLADEVTDTPSAIRAVIRRGRCNKLRRNHPHALLLTALFVAELQQRDGDGAGGAVPWADVWERLSVAAPNSSSRVKWIALAGRPDQLKTLVNMVEKLTDSMSNKERMSAAKDGALVAIARVLVARAGSGGQARALESTRLCSIFVAILLTLIEECGVVHVTEQMGLVVAGGLLQPVSSRVRATACVHYMSTACPLHIHCVSRTPPRWRSCSTRA